MEFLESTRVGYRVSSERARALADEGRGEEAAWDSDGEEGVPGTP